MTPDEAARFWHYGYCPRGSGDAAEHGRKNLVHASVGGRRVCIAAELLDEVRSR